jgi:hypothetical protein
VRRQASSIRDGGLMEATGRTMILEKALGKSQISDVIVRRIMQLAFRVGDLVMASTPKQTKI